jgi:hypothetical protein
MNKIVNKYLLVCFVLIAASQLFGTTYYVDSSWGNDSSTGTSINTPWQTIAKINNYSFHGGDSILFKRGGIWKERLVFPSSGNAFIPIVIGSYGEGNLPIITGVNNYNGWNNTNTWTLAKNNIWSRKQLENPQRMWVNGKEILRNIEIDSLDGVKYNWAWEKSKLYLYSDGNPATTFSSMEVNVFLDVVRINNKYFIIIGDIKIEGGSGFALSILGGNNIVVENCNIGTYSRQGIHICEYDGISSSFVKIDNCMLDSKFNFSYGKNKGIDDGILVSSGANNCVIKNNTIKDFGHAGIYLKALRSYNNGVYDNKIFNNYITGENVTYQRGIGTDGYEGKCRDNEFFYNVIKNTTVRNQINGNNNWIHHNIIDGIKNTSVKSYATAQGFDLQCYGADLVCHDNKIDNNLIMNCEEPGIYFRGNGKAKKNNFIRNNLILNCGTNSKEGYDNIGIVIENHSSIETNYFYNNCVFNGNENSNVVSLRGTKINISDFNSQESTSDVASNNIQKNPLLEISDSLDYYLNENSPCIDAGIDVGLLLDFYGNKIFNGNAPDIGIYECFETTNILSTNLSIVKSFLLEQNYPNPFNPTTTIEYQIPKDGFVNLVVYNSLGQVVATLVNEYHTIGKYSIKFNASNLTSGVYFYKIVSGDFSKINKMLLLR